nr:MAG: AAA family ATPase [Candidatus Methanoperedens sp.]
MQITGVRIKNFKSIKELEFHPKTITALIGGNNAGKSNILTAIERILGSKYPMINYFEPDDFYNRDESNKIEISLELIDKKNNPHNIFFGYKNGNRGENYYFEIDGYPANDEKRKRYPFLRLTTNRAIADNMPSNRWSLWGKILREINDELQQDQVKCEKLKGELKAIKENYLETTTFKRLVEVLQKEAADQLNKSTSDFKVDFQMYDPLNYYKSLQILVKDGSLEFQASEMGMGMQSSLTVALLRAYAEIKTNDSIIAIDEPEIFLHPQAQRSFYRIIRHLGKTGTQVFYTTHSNQFVDVEYFDEIFVVRKEKDLKGQISSNISQLEVSQLIYDLVARYPKATPDSKSIREAYRNICCNSRNEGFFAQKVVLVEGATEEFSIPVYFDALDYNVDRHGISIINAEGKGNLDRLYRIYNEFKIPTYIIMDGDSGKDKDGDSKRLTKGILEMLYLNSPIDYPPTTVADVFAIFEVDYETTVRAEILEYNTLELETRKLLGKRGDEGKGMVAKVVAENLIVKGVKEGYPKKYIPRTIQAIHAHIREMKWHVSVLRRPANL